MLAPTNTMPPPETLNTLLKVPDALFVVFPTADKDTVLKFVTLGVLAEIVMVPADAPTDTMPAPEIFIRPEKVPVLPSVVFPNAVMDCVMVWTLAEIVMVLLAWPVPIPAPAERETLLLVPFRLKFV